MNKKTDWMTISTFLMMFFTFCLAIATAYQAYQSKRAIDLQYTPQLDIDVDSSKIPVILDGNNYVRADYFDIYRNNFITSTDSTGKTSLTGDVYIPLNITIYNIGNIGTRLERMRYNFSCDLSGEKDMQIDMLNSTVIPPQKELHYNYGFFITFSNIPNADQKCPILFKFFFYNGLEEQKQYFVWYHNYNLTVP